MLTKTWERPLHQPGQDTGLAWSEHAVVVHERLTRLVCLDPEDGSPRWDVPCGTWPRGVVIAGRRVLVLPQDRSELRCFDLATGERVWTTPVSELTGHLAVNDDVVLVGGWRAYTPVTAFGLTTGERRWRSFTHTVLPAAIRGGFLLGAPGDRRVRLADKDTGRKVSSWKLPHRLVDADHQSVFTESADRILLRCGEQTVVEIDHTGGVRVAVSARHPLRAVAPQLVDDQIWAVNHYGQFAVVDARDGEHRYQAGGGHLDAADVVPVANGHLVVTGHGVVNRVDDRGWVVETKGVAHRFRVFRRHGGHHVLALTKGKLCRYALNEPR